MLGRQVFASHHAHRMIGFFLRWFLATRITSRRVPARIAIAALRRICQHVGQVGGKLGASWSRCRGHWQRPWRSPAAAPRRRGFRQRPAAADGGAAQQRWRCGVVGGKADDTRIRIYVRNKRSCWTVTSSSVCCMIQCTSEVIGPSLLTLI